MDSNIRHLKTNTTNNFTKENKTDIHGVQRNGGEWGMLRRRQELKKYVETQTKIRKDGPILLRIKPTRKYTNTRIK